MIREPIRILVTGAGGFIGRAALTALAKQFGGASLHAVTRRHGDHLPPLHGIMWHKEDLLQPGAAKHLIEKIKPTHCIHAAWETRSPLFWTSPENKSWVEASIALAHAFGQNRGQYFLSLGSVAEYEWSTGRMTEEQTLQNPKTLYGQSKLEFHHHLTSLGQHYGYSTSIGRVFFVYGPHENPTKLVASACRALALRETVTFGPLDLWRDYIHVDDLGRAIAHLVEQRIEGIFNLASGDPVRQAYLIETLARQSGRGDLFHIGHRKNNPDDPEVLFADTAKIRATGWAPRITLEDGLNATRQWWLHHARHAA